MALPDKLILASDIETAANDIRGDVSAPDGRYDIDVQAGVGELLGTLGRGCIGSPAHQLALATASQTQHQRQNLTGEQLRVIVDCGEGSVDVQRLPDPDTCQLQPSQLALSSFLAADGYAAHRVRKGPALFVDIEGAPGRRSANFTGVADPAARTSVIALDALGDLIATALRKNEPFVVMGGREDCLAMCHWHKLATVRLQAATTGKGRLIVISTTIGGGAYHTVFFDKTILSLHPAVIDAAARIAAIWKYPSAATSRATRAATAATLGREVSAAIAANVELVAGVPCYERRSRFAELRDLRPSRVSGEQLVSIPGTSSKLLLDTDASPPPVIGRAAINHAVRHLYQPLAAATLDTEVSIFVELSASGDLAPVDAGESVFLELVGMRHTDDRSEQRHRQSATGSLDATPVALTGEHQARYRAVESVVRTRTPKNLLTALFAIQLADTVARVYSVAAFIHTDEGVFCVDYGAAQTETEFDGIAAPVILHALGSGTKLRFGLTPRAESLRAPLPLDAAPHTTFTFSATLASPPPRTDAELIVDFKNVVSLLNKHTLLYACHKTDRLVAQSLQRLFALKQTEARRLLALVRPTATATEKPFEKEVMPLLKHTGAS